MHEQNTTYYIQGENYIKKATMVTNFSSRKEIS